MFLTATGKHNSSWEGGSELKGKIYKLHQGKNVAMTPPVSELESLGFEWDSLGTAWEERLSELAGSQNPQALCFSTLQRNTKLGGSPSKSNYKLHAEGKKSYDHLAIPGVEQPGFQCLSGTHVPAMRPATTTRSSCHHLKPPPERYRLRVASQEAETRVADLATIRSNFSCPRK
jgi:hypothetical protein